MEYKRIKKGIFKERPNRFIAVVNIDGKDEVCHVKNTGRCKELLVKGSKVFLEESDNTNRKTKYDLISVYKGDMLVNIDSQAPNKVFSEWVKESGYFENLSLVKPECTYENSRFDFYLECGERKIFVEVKGVTLEKNGEVSFPDAPTLRGVKHINELCECKKHGYEAYIFFVVQMEKADCFVPNRRTHKDFADALCNAEKQGVKIKCVNCTVTETTLKIKDFIKTELQGGDILDNVTKKLFDMQDSEYKKFHSKLMPTINPNTIIGVRTPELRKFSKEFFRTGDYEGFLNKLPHKYYEENNLHAFLIEHIKDYDKVIEKTEDFLPYIDNWATSDMFLPKVFKKNKERLFEKICLWIKSDKTYTVRYAIGLLLKLYLDEEFSEIHLDMVAEIKSDEYYINMMRAWYFATALAKQHEKTLPYLTENKLDKWTHNKTIQKALESYRIDKNRKPYLKELKS